MIKRKITAYLESYFSEGRKEALLITGARQIGKSYAIREFGRSHYESFVELNFIENPAARAAFSSAKNSSDLLLRLSALTSVELKKGKTLVFLDEVQKVPEIITAIKFLVEEGSYQYVLSGSLLGVELHGVTSVPVGYMTVKEMYPLDFEEFFSACGLTETVLEKLRHAFLQRVPVDSIVHERMMDLFRLYMIVGGMPAVVQTYLESNDIQKVLQKQREILALYREDISQYDVSNKLYIEDVFDLIPAELNAQNKRFILKDLNENTRFSRYEDSFIWLREAGVALPTYNVEAPKNPLALAKLRNLFKLYANDVGLLAAQYADGIQLRILTDDSDINYGAIYENVVAEELHSHGFPLYYFNSKKQGELDFVVKVDDQIVPIEVKSGKSYFRHNALKNVMDSSEYDIPEAYVLCNDNLQVKGKIVYIPIYLVMFLRNTELKSMIYKVDLSGIL